MRKNLIFSAILIFITSNFITLNVKGDTHNLKEILELIQKDIKTLEKAVYSEENLELTNNNSLNEKLDQNSEDVLTRHLLKLSEIESQFQNLTNRFEEINFKLDKLSSRLSKVQADNQLRLQQIEKTINNNITNEAARIITSDTNNSNKILPGSSQPQDLGSISYKDTLNDNKEQETQSIDSTATIMTEKFVAEDKILPDTTASKQYEFATGFLKIGDYNTAERAFREFVLTNPDHNLAGNAQYWYAETFRIRQLYTDAASA